MLDDLIKVDSQPPSRWPHENQQIRNGTTINVGNIYKLNFF